MKELSTHAKAAKLIREELKSMGLVGSKVRSEAYAGGTSISITLKDVNELWYKKELRRKLDKYCYGSYDGLSDSYVADNVRDDVPQVRHLFVK